MFLSLSLSLSVCVCVRTHAYSAFLDLGGLKLQLQAPRRIFLLRKHVFVCVRSIWVFAMIGGEVGVMEGGRVGEKREGGGKVRGLEGGGGKRDEREGGLREGGGFKRGAT